MTQTQLSLKSRNPDVLTCIANLSNDAVFTPPELAKEMLAMLEKAWSESNNGESIWENSKITFLDPCTKTGIFLREIVKRLVAGLEKEIPDLQERVDHILTKQVFGIATETLTGLLARRSVYCSKYANGVHSIAKSFDDENGNIWFERTEHTWVGGNETVLTADEKGNPVEKKKNGRCKYCGASQLEYDRDESLESHAYAFIHAENIEECVSEIFGEDMKFDVIIGNPPYQLDTGGSGRQAKPIYNLFVEQAKKLEPRFLSMVIQSRWFGGGMGLGNFRDSMLNDDRLKVLVDYTNSGEVFPGTDFGGGACYFLWDKNSSGPCRVVNHMMGKKFESVRKLNEFEHFIRYAPAVPILQKVMARKEQMIGSLVSSTRPFGIPTTEVPRQTGDYKLISSKGEGYIKASDVTSGEVYINSWKVLTSKTSHDHAGLPDKNGQRRVLSRLEIIPPGTVCTESYILVGPFDSEAEASNCLSYLGTRFARFLVSLLSYSQDITRGRFDYLPVQTFSQYWSDEELYKKYGLDEEEIAFIESIIRPMEID